MDTDEPRLPLSRYQLTYRAIEDLRLPAYPRSLWHGVLGLNLKRIACVAPSVECRHCLLLHQCDYAYLFSGPRPPGAEMMRRYDSIPVPHVFRVEAPLPPRIRPGESFAVSLVLIGAANARLPIVVRALAAAGELGLGKECGRAMLKEVRQQSPDRGGTSWVISTGERLLPPDPPVHPELPPQPELARLHFLSPYKPSGAAAGPQGMDLGRLLMAIVRRVSLLQYFYTGSKLDADFSALKAGSQRAQVLAYDLRIQPGRRSSASHGTRVDTSGVLGHLDLSLQEIEPFWPYLHLGQWLGVGKNASMGFGQYEVIASLE